MDAAYTALYEGGILVAGTHTTYTGPGGKGTRLDGNALYLQVTPAKGEVCGNTICGDGLVCCNASCGICTEPGMFCIQIACQSAE